MDFPVEKLDWFEQWEKETGETPPDFTQLPSNPELPKLLQFENGEPIKTEAQWLERRKELKELLQRYILGAFPKEVPALTGADVIHTKEEQGALIQQIQLTFDTANQASFAIEIMRPAGEGPFPVMMTQTNHRRWGLIAVSRGYLVCLYPGADIDDQTAVFKEAYPHCDWSLLSRRAWLGSRALDYLLTRDDVNPGLIGITGHSRNGKQSLIAAAMDERITAVISSSSGSGGAGPFRFNSESRFQESVEFMTRNFPEWFHPRLRYFTGREDQLPVDCHAYLGLIAPRPCLLSAALNDSCECTYALEQSYASGKEVYEFLRGPAEALSIRYRPGSHETHAEDIQTYVDWFEYVWGKAADNPIEHRVYHHFDWKEWASKQPQELRMPEQSNFTADGAKTNEEKKRRIEWMLGKEPALAMDAGGSYGKYPEHLMSMLGHRHYKPASVKIHPFSFGGYIRGNLYYTMDLPKPAPVVIWLHPFSYPVGYPGGYTKNEKIYNYLAEQGYAVFAYDQLGFGSRLEEGAQFYRRYPEWSKLGKMVADVSSLIDCILADGSEHPDVAFHSFPEFDTSQIYCVGYALGGMVALYAASLDQRITGVASFSGLSPLKEETASLGRSKGNNRSSFSRWYEADDLLPRLGLFEGTRKNIPYDFDDVLSLIAPRPCYIDSPLHDRENCAETVKKLVDRARTAWAEHKLEQQLTHLMRNDYNRFEPEQHRLVKDWLSNIRS